MNDYSFTNSWHKNIHAALYGKRVAPRGKKTKELLHNTVKFCARSPVLLNTDRKLSYRFMAAEAYWIITGDNSVKGIEPYNKHISQFSDNGVVFNGAYGPSIVHQLDYVVNKLYDDPCTRQAGLTIWKENPPETKDYPCTIAVFFSIRGGFLNSHVFMRSSDLWLGLPYDAFNCSMLNHHVCDLHNAKCLKDRHKELMIEPGDIYITAASSHLYEENEEDAKRIVANLANSSSMNAKLTPEILFDGSGKLLPFLENLRNTKPGDIIRWWEYHA